MIAQTMMRTGLLCASALLAGCFSQPRTPDPALYDLGIAPAARAAPARTNADLAAVRVRAGAPSWLDGTSMYYRLLYVDELRTLTYAYARWVAPPAELVSQRLRQRLAEPAGGIGSASGQVLQIEVEEFVQLFETPTRSFGRVSVRVQLSGASSEEATFSEQIAAPTPDAAGGVRALAEATDALIARIVEWIGGARNGKTADKQMRLSRTTARMRAAGALDVQLAVYGSTRGSSEPPHPRPLPRGERESSLHSPARPAGYCCSRGAVGRRPGVVWLVLVDYARVKR